MMRNGKIARLPKEIREQINLRLQNGEEGKPILEWLNALPEVTAVLTADFGSQPVSDMNLSNWRLGGFRDWLARQESLEAIQLFRANAAEFKKAGAGQLTEQLALCLTARLGVALQNSTGDATDQTAQLDQLRRLCADLAGLRKGDHNAAWLRLERQRADLEREKFLHKTAVERKELRDKRNPPKSVPRAVLDQVVKDLNLLGTGAS